MSLSNKMTESIKDTTAFWPGFSAPSFEAPVVFSGSTSTVNLQSLRGSYGLLIFYPMDFDYISPTELTMLDESLEEFKQENCEVMAISTTSILSKIAFLSLSKEQGGVAGIRIGLVEDKDGEIGHKYGVMKEGSGYTYRAMVLIDKEGVIIFRSVFDLPIGCGIGEALMIVKQVNQAKNSVKADDKTNSTEKKTEKNEAGENEVVEKSNKETEPNDVTKEKPMNPSVADEVNLKDDVTSKKPNDKKSVTSAGDVAGDDKEVGPETCDCDLEFSHSVNLHKLSTLEKKKNSSDTE